MTIGRRATGVVLLLLGLGLLAAAWLLTCGLPAPSPTATPTALPTISPTALPTPPPTVAQGVLTVHCNGPAAVRLLDYWSGQELLSGTCAVEDPLRWAALPRQVYRLHAESAGEVEAELEHLVDLRPADAEVTARFPGVLAVWPTPGEATVRIGQNNFQGEARLVYPPEQCPLTVTVVVEAPGYQSAVQEMGVEAGRVNGYTVGLEPQPTTTPTPEATAAPTAAPVTPRPTAPPATAVPPPPPPPQDMQALMLQMWQNFNQVRQENGLPTVDYDHSLQAQANEAARQFYVTNRGISREELDAIVAPGWWAYISNNVPLAGGVCGLPPDYTILWHPNFVVSYARDLPSSVRAITFGYYGSYSGTCGTSATIVLVARY